MSEEKVIEIRFPEREGQAILEELAKPPVRGCERVVLALTARSTSLDCEAILVTSPRGVPEDAYAMTSEGTAWDPSFTARVASEALRRHRGVIVIHAHPFGRKPRLSGPDERSFSKLLPALRATVPDRPHGSVVVGSDLGVGGKVWFFGDRAVEVSRVRWLDSPLKILPSSDKQDAISNLYKSQVDLIGEGGQRLLQRATLGVIGLGGGGSHVVQQASRAGFGTLVLDDRDKVEE